MNKVQNFRQQMADHGLDPGEIIPDGAIHRFPTWGDGVSETSGAYWHNGSVGWFQDHRTMEKPEIVKGKLSKADQKALNGSFTGANNKVSREALETGIRRIWNAGTEPDGHPYLTRKGITAPLEVKQHEGCLVIPVFGVNRELNGLQRIDANGRKKFLAGTRKKGSMFGIKGNGTYIICEGFSTGVSLHEATGASIAVAFDAGNLLHVARAVSKKVNPKNIIIAGDNDAWKLEMGQPNIGADMAKKAGIEIGARVAIPEFKKPNGKDTTDFNDLHIIEGAEVVKKQVEGAAPYTLESLKNQITTENTSLEKEVKAIAGLPIFQREIERNRIAKEYAVRKPVIDKYIKEFTKKEEAGGTAEVVTEIEPFESEVNGARLLDTISKKISKHVILPDGAAEAIATWCVLTYCYDAFRILPLLGIVSPIKRCGKTTLLETLQGLANKSLIASNISPSAVFRTIHKYNPTLLIDEADTFLKDNNELRGVLNSGHTKKSAYVVRLVGDNHETMKFSTWGPKAVSMIGKALPDTLQDRAIVIKLKRKAPGENSAKLSIDFEDDCLDIRRKCQRWADDNMEKLSMTDPDMPKTNNDRMTDNWMPLFAIAEVAGGDWPELIKNSMMKMLDVSEDEISLMLLEDIRNIFNSNGAERMFSDDLVEALINKSERPWCDWNRGRGLTQNGLAKLLKPYDVKSKTMRIRDGRRNGYELDGFKDAFKRYIFILPSELPISTVTTRQVNNIRGLNENQNVTDNIRVTDKKQDNPLNLKECHNVTDENGGSGENKKFTMEI